MIRTRLFASIFCAAAVSLVLTGCGQDKKAAAPAKPGSISHSWFAANETWKQGDYEKTLDYLSRLAVAQSEYRDRSRQWVILTAAGLADGYRELADAYEAGARVSKQYAADYRRQVVQHRNSANAAAMLFAETIHDMMDKDKDVKLKFDFGFPSGSAADPPQLSRIEKGLSLQPADHEAVKKAMVTRGILRFAAAIAAADGDVEKAKAQFANPPREVAIAAVANKLITIADIYGSKKMDFPKRGNALVKEAEEAAAMLPSNSKDRKEIDKKLKEELKRFAIKS